MVDSQDQRGRPAYACTGGDTAIWRRQPLQLQTTLAFMLAKDEGRPFRVKAADSQTFTGVCCGYARRIHTSGC